MSNPSRPNRRRSGPAGLQGYAGLGLWSNKSTASPPHQALNAQRGHAAAGRGVAGSGMSCRLPDWLTRCPDCKQAAEKVASAREAAGSCAQVPDEGWVPHSSLVSREWAPLLTVNVSSELTVGGKVQWNPTSREKRARCGHPAFVREPEADPIESPEICLPSVCAGLGLAQLSCTLIQIRGKRSSAGLLARPK